MYRDPVRDVNVFSGEAPFPLPPLNAFVTHPYIYGTLDIRWDNPEQRPENTRFNILGVKIYKSLNSEIGPYRLITPNLIGSSLYRDKVSHAQINDEDVSSTLNLKNNPQKEVFFTTLHKPITKATGELNGNVGLTNADHPSDVIVKIDSGDGNGLIKTPVRRVNGERGEIYLIDTAIYDPTTEKILPARIPTGNPGSITCSYRYQSNIVQTRLDRKVFYKITTVGTDPSATIVETPLENTPAITAYSFEQTDWIWFSAIRKTRWMLEQAGERVKIFIRKWMGEQCPNYSDIHGDGIRDCDICFGTQIIGGYEGPFDVIIAPPETPREVSSNESGLRLNMVYETWTGPTPLLSQRDFLVKPNGERFSIGPVTPQGLRGNVLQQHFQIGYIDEGDIRYKVPIYGAALSIPAEFDQHRESPKIILANTDVPVPAQAPSYASPIIPNKPEDPSREGTSPGQQKRGRTPTFENITY